jgi:hypothetical protein
MVDNSVYTMTHCYHTITYSVVLSLHTQPLHRDTHWYHTITYAAVLSLHTQPLHNDTLRVCNGAITVCHCVMVECVMIGQQHMQWCDTSVCHGVMVECVIIGQQIM